MIGPWASDEAEAFANALEGRGPRNSEVQDLVRFAESLCEAAVDPTAEFLTSLRADLMADAATVLVKAPVTARLAQPVHVIHPVRRRIAAATAALLASAGMVGIVGSSAQALPGETLYPVKRTVESVQLQLHRSEASRGAFQLSLASERLAEAQDLAKTDGVRSDEFVTKSLGEFTEKAEVGSQALFSDFQIAGNAKSIDKVNEFVTESSSVLAKLSDDLAPGAADAYEVAAALVTGLASQASDMCSTCEDAELSSLARTVGGIADSLNNAANAPDPRPTPDKVEATKAAPTTGGSTALPPPPTSILPSPTPTLPAGGVGSVTDPAVRGLLGGDDQVGLVPGLLDALLGGK